MEEFEDQQINPHEPIEMLDADEQAPTTSCWSVLREILETILLAGFLFLVINGLTARVRVDGPSMEPSYFDRDRIVVSKVSYFFSDVERGDVIVFPAPLSPEEDYINARDRIAW